MKIFLLTVLLAVSRLIPHPPNATALSATTVSAGRGSGPIFAMLSAVFAMFFADATLALLSWFQNGQTPFPWVATSLEDVFTLGTIAVYGATALMALFASRARLDSFLRFGSVAIVSTLAFFVVTNFAAWIELGYPRTFEGLATCYLGALPFLGYQLAGDAVWVPIAWLVFARLKSPVAETNQTAA